MRKTDCHGTDGGIHGDFGVDHLASGRHGNTHRGENGRCQWVSADCPLCHLSGKISRDHHRLCGIYISDSGSLRAVDIESVFANATVRKLAAKLAVFGIAIFLVVPASVKISDLIGDTYQAQIEATIEDAKSTQNILETVTQGMIPVRRKLEPEQQKQLQRTHRRKPTANQAQFRIS